MMKDENQCVMLVTDDKYQLPIITVDSLHELADILGCSYTTVCRCARTQKTIRLPKNRFEGLKRGRVVKVSLAREQEDK